MVCFKVKSLGPQLPPAGFPPGLRQQGRMANPQSGPQHQPLPQASGQLPIQGLTQGPIQNLPPGLTPANPQPISLGPQTITQHSLPSGQAMMNRGGQPSIPQNSTASRPQFEMPAAPPASPQVVQAQPNGEAQTAELITFD